MQFIIMAKDGTDGEALTRRLAAREAHIAYSDKAIKTGEQIIAAALLDDKDQMRGSLMIVDFPDLETLKKWLENEAYITGNVWKDIDVIPCKIGPSFQHLVKKAHN